MTDVNEINELDIGTRFRVVNDPPIDLSADASLQRGLEQARAGQTVEAPDLGIDAAEFIENTE